MKKVGYLSITFLLVLSLCGAASAASYSFNDTIDWSGYGSWGWEGVPIHNGFSYSHDIRDDVDFGAGDLVTEATLELNFVGDWGDYYNYSWVCAYDFREFTFIQFDDTSWHYVDEVDNDSEFLTVGIDWLNDDGLLDVSLYVWNPLNMALAWLQSSSLTGYAQTGSGSGSPAPVPEPGTMILLGMGLAGIGVPGRKKIFKNK